MEQKDWKAFYQTIQQADEMMTGKARPDSGIAGMFNVLLNYDITQIQRAVATHVCKASFIIKPRDIIELIEGDPADKSIVAWNTFKRALEKYGRWESVRFPEPAYNYVIEQLGGWIKVATEYGEMTDKEIQFREKDWRQLFEIGARLASWDIEQGKVTVPRYCWGIHESENRAMRYWNALPPINDVATGAYLPPSLPAPEEQAALPPMIPVVTFGGIG